MEILSKHTREKKIFLSVAFGITSLLLSPYGFKVVFGEIALNIPWSIILPILISMSLGWKYGLLAGFSGGAYFPFLLWPNDGWACLFTVLLYQVVYAIIGLIYDMHYIKILTKITGRIILIVAFCLIIFTLYYGLFFNEILRLNPPFWYAKSIGSVSTEVLTGFLIKESINLVYLILISETLLMIPILRRLLGIPSKKEYDANTKIFIITISAFLIIWLSFVSLGSALLRGPNALQLPVIALSFIVIQSSGILTSRALIYFYSKQLEIQNHLNYSNEKLKVLYENSNEAIIVLNESRALNNSIINSTSDLIWSCNLVDFGLTTFNLAFGKHFLKTRGIEIRTGLLPEDILPTEFAESWRKYYRKTIENGSYSLEYRTHDGSLILELNFNILKHDGIAFGISVFGKDITIRKTTEDALIESENKYSRIVNTANEGILTVNKDGFINYVNVQATKMLGYNFDELLDHHIENFIYKPELEDHRQKVEMRIHGISETFERRFIRKDGTIIWILISATPLKDKDMNNQGSFAMLNDITERKLAEQRLNESEERFRNLADLLPQSIFETDLDGTITYVNKFALDLFGYSQEEIHKGLKAFNFLVAEDVIRSKEKIKTVFSEHIATKSEYTAIKKDGTEFPVIIYSNAIKSNEQFVGIRGIIFDVSEIKQAEQEVHKLFHIIEQSPVSILITNPEGYIEYSNPRFTELTGYSSEEVKGKNPRILKSGQTSDRDYAEMWNKIRGGKEWKGEFYNRKKNGDFFWESAMISPIINNKGQITHFISADEDITEKKESERQMLHTIIETEENERNRFSRELHDGLGPIMSTAKLYFQWLAENTNPDERINIVTKGNHCINEAIQSLREISNNLSPRVLSNLGIVSAIQNFINLLNETEKLIIEFDFNIDKRFEKNIEITVYRVTTELINNTIKYANATKARLRLNYARENSQLVLDYSDAGIGFDLNEVMYAKKGHGLVNIQQRVKTLNGKVLFKAATGKGLEVYIELPV